MLLGYCNLNLSIKIHSFESVNLCLVQISSQSNTQPPQKVSRHTLLVPMDLGMLLTLLQENLKEFGFEFQLYYLFYKQGGHISGLTWIIPSCLLCKNHYYSSAFHSQKGPYHATYVVPCKNRSLFNLYLFSYGKNLKNFATLKYIVSIEILTINIFCSILSEGL